MDKFWDFARMTLHYRRYLFFALIGVVINAICSLGGLGTLTFIIEKLFQQNETIKAIVTEKIGEQYASYLPDDQMTSLAMILGIVFLFSILGSVGRYMHEYFIYTVSYRTVMRIRRQVFERLILMPMGRLSADLTGDSVNRVVRDSASIGVGFNMIFGKAVASTVVGTGMIIAAFYTDWFITALFLTVIPVMAVLMRKFGKTMRRSSRRASQHYGVMIGMMTEVLHGLRVVKTNHAEGGERRRFGLISRAVYDQEMKARVARSLSAPLSELIAIVGMMIVMMVAGWSIFNGQREGQDLFIVLMFLLAGASTFRKLTGFNNNMQIAAAAAIRVDELMQYPAEPTPSNQSELEKPSLPRHTNSVTLNDVTFTYPGADLPTLKNINLEVNHGQVCAIVGGNGSGKTTMLGLIPRLYEPDSGQVLVDGHDVAQHTLRSLRKQVAVVTQEATLFDGTIEDNIRYGLRHASHDQVIAAAKQAYVHEFVDKMEHGYQSQVGERGQKLSGGQRQRIAIARAILRDPAILILDEATSQIDTDSEAKINQALAEFEKDRTTFIIAHRLSTVVGADVIVVLDAGQVVGIGKHQELMQSCDAYQNLCRNQLQDDS